MRYFKGANNYYDRVAKQSKGRNDSSLNPIRAFIRLENKIF